MEELINDYERKIKAVNELLEAETNEFSVKRLETKRGCYRAFIVDLKRALANSSDETAALPLHGVMRCVNCKFYEPIDDTHGECSNQKFFVGYGSDLFKNGAIDLDGVNVEGDEGWGFEVGKNFGCIHFQHNA